MDGIHFLAAGIHTGRYDGLDTDIRNGIPTFSFCSRLYVRHGLQAQVSHLSEAHDGNIILYEKYKHNKKPEEEYIDLIPILKNLYFNVDKFLNSIKGVEVATDRSGLCKVFCKR